MKEYHYPVLLKESIELLDIKPNGIYVDGTFGRGGHTKEILARLSKNGKIIAFDKDPDAHTYAVEHFKDKRLTLIHDSFANMMNCLASLGIKQVDGILLDLGVSSPQLDDEKRGFSFRFDATLDMRMNTHCGVSAREWINSATERELADVLWNYGEERFYKKIAKAIVDKRQSTPIETTKELADLIDNTMPFKEKGKNPATRSFQAIRIFINNELGELELLLAQIPELLAINGVMVVISFHSLEDRIVKNAFNNLAKAKSLPKWVMAEPELPNYQVIAKKVKASASELEENVRSRSSILRAIKHLRNT
ncbi:MAG TPA: 16S rRNA (cytosine(1402)-N(4))-methyltransferase RsmH [Aquella sp.]|nr:16S rRNA (cytosine(1402)-N(4))-methyltransferase RsmH [Aquella sp.]